MNSIKKSVHSSAFQTISRRSVYIKIINYSESISTNLNKTTCDEQNRTLIQIETRFTMDYFL